MFRCSKLPLATRYRKFHYVDPFRIFFFRYLVFYTIKEKQRMVKVTNVNVHRITFNVCNIQD